MVCTWEYFSLSLFLLWCGYLSLRCLQKKKKKNSAKSWSLKEMPFHKQFPEIGVGILSNSPTLITLMVFLVAVTCNGRCAFVRGGVCSPVGRIRMHLGSLGKISGALLDHHQKQKQWIQRVSNNDSLSFQICFDVYVVIWGDLRRLWAEMTSRSNSL